MAGIIISAGFIAAPLAFLIYALYRDRQARKRIAQIDAQIARLRHLHAVKPGEITPRDPVGIERYKRDRRRREFQIIRDHERVYSEDTGVGQTEITGEKRRET